MPNLMPTPATLPLPALPPVITVDTLVAQALGLLTAAYRLAQQECAGWNVELLDEAAALCRDWLTARGEG